MLELKIYSNSFQDSERIIVRQRFMKNVKLGKMVSSGKICKDEERINEKFFRH